MAGHLRRAVELLGQHVATTTTAVTDYLEHVDADRASRSTEEVMNHGNETTT